MISAWLFVAAIIVIVIVVMKISSAKQEWAVKIVMFLFIFLALTLGYVYVSTQADIKSVEGVEDLASAYYTWLASAFGNVKTATSNVVGMDWSLKNATRT